MDLQTNLELGRPHLVVKAQWLFLKAARTWKNRPYRRGIKMPGGCTGCAHRSEEEATCHGLGRIMRT